MAVVLAVALVCGSCCQRSVGEREGSSTGEWVALVTVTECGAFSDYATAVTLRRTRSWLARNKVVVGLVGRHSVGITWPDAHTLHVYLPSSARERDFVEQKVVNRHEEVDGIRIEYSQL